MIRVGGGFSRLRKRKIKRSEQFLNLGFYDFAIWGKRVTGILVSLWSLVQFGSALLIVEPIKRFERTGFFFGFWRLKENQKKQKMWWMMGETGGHYCNKKTDDICGDVCGQVFVFCFSLIYVWVFFLNYGGTVFDLFVSVKVSVFLVFEFCDWVLVLWVCLFDSWGNMEKRVDLGSLGSA